MAPSSRAYPRGIKRLAGADAAFTYDMYYTIINERYDAQLPVILTSNLHFEPWAGGGLSLATLSAAVESLGSWK